MRISAAVPVMLTAALLVSAAACTGPGGVHGGSGDRTGEPATSKPAARASSAVTALCGPPEAPGRLIAIRAADGVRLAAFEAGAGRRGVLLIPEHGAAGKCGWWDYAAYLAASGFRVLAFDHRCTGGSACPPGRAVTDLMSDIRGAVSRLRQEGAPRVALVGASQGGAEAVIAAAVPPRGVTGVVALSADELTLPLASAPYPRTALAAASRLRLPAVFAVAAADPYVSVQETRHLVAVAGSRSKRLVLLGAGSGHGWDMLVSGGGARPALSRQVVTFLRGVTS